MLFPVLLLFVAGAFLLLLSAGCAWLERRHQATQRRGWLSSHHDSGWCDTSHVLETTKHNHGVLDWIGGDGDADAAAGGCAGGDCGGGDGGGDGGGGD